MLGLLGTVLRMLLSILVETGTGGTPSPGIGVDVDLGAHKSRGLILDIYEPTEEMLGLRSVSTQTDNYYEAISQDRGNQNQQVGELMS